MSEKIIRDPVHDVIAFDVSRPTDRLLFDLLNAVEFQRLRRIRQLGLASLAYPGADHSRYAHSLGVMETARKILSCLDRATAHHHTDPDAHTTTLVAALVHDLGHGPFSHVFERVTGVHHELHTRRVILDPTSEVHRKMVAFEPTLPDKVIALLDAHPKPSYLSDVLSSQLDADRLDYLLRDNYMTGSRYGDYDLQWLLRAFTVDPNTHRLAVHFKGISAVEAYLQARYHMYRNVYFHKVVRSAEGMLKLALQRARRLAVQDRLLWPPREHGVYKALLGQHMTMPEFVELDDVSVLHCFKTWTTSEDLTLAHLCQGLLYRRLYKSVDLSHVDEPTAHHVTDLATDAVARAGGDPAYDLFYDEPANTPYETYRPDDPTAAKEILVVDRTGQLKPFAEMSPFVAALNQLMTYRRLHFNPQYRDPILNEIRPMIR